MGQRRRVHKGSDRIQKWHREQRDLVEADFRAIEERYHRELVTLRDGTKGLVFGERPPERKPEKLPTVTHIGATDPDGLLELAMLDHQHQQEARRIDKECREEAKDALRQKGVTFQQEPKSIEAGVQGRFSSIEKRTNSKQKEFEAQPYSYSREGPKGRWRQRG